MSDKREYKTALTPEEKIKCAYLHYIRKTPQHDLAIAFEVNGGRINEACKAVWAVVSNEDKSNGNEA